MMLFSQNNGACGAHSNLMKKCHAHEGYYRAEFINFFHIL